MMRQPDLLQDRLADGVLRSRGRGPGYGQRTKKQDLPHRAVVMVLEVS
jgi:hypothetical protein